MRHVLFVHGMFMTGRTFAPWLRWLEARGLQGHAPSWPGRESAPADARRSPDPALRTLTLTQLVDQYEAAARALPEAPLLIGHSMGGLVVQLLLQRGVGHSGVVLGSAPPTGIKSFAFSHLRSNAAVLWPGSSPIRPSLGWFRYAFFHTASDAELQAAFDEHIVPESRVVGRGPLGPEARVDFEKPRAPLLFLSGAEDRIIPASLNEKNVKAYRPEAGKTAWEVLPGRTHFLANQPGWEELAQRAIDWAR